MNKGKQSLKDAVVRHVKGFAVIFATVGTSIALLISWQGESWRSQYIDTALVVGLHWLIIFQLIWHILGHERPAYFGIPRVIKVLRSDSILLVEIQPWLGIGALTTIYVMEDEVERLLCGGEVINVQFNDFVQIAIRTEDVDYNYENELWKTLERTPTDQLIVKPGAYHGSK